MHKFLVRFGFKEVEKQNERQTLLSGTLVTVLSPSGHREGPAPGPAWWSFHQGACQAGQAEWGAVRNQTRGLQAFGEPWGKEKRGAPGL